MERYMVLLKSFKRMPIELEQTLRNNFRPMEVRKGDIIQQEDTLTDKLYFVEKGLIRLFVTRWEGQQVSMRFKREDEFIIAAKSVFEDEKMGDGLEALEDGLLWAFPGPLIKELKLQYIQFVEQFSAIIGKDLIHLEEASYCRDFAGAEYSYRQIQKYFPEWLNRVPIEYLASFADTSEDEFKKLHAKNEGLPVMDKVRRKPG